MAPKNTVVRLENFTAFAIVLFSSTFLSFANMLGSENSDLEKIPDGGSTTNRLHGIPPPNKESELYKPTTTGGPALGKAYRFNLTASHRKLAEDVTTFVCGSAHLCRDADGSTTDRLCDFDCSPCQCDDMCHFYGDCCPDLLFGDSPDKPSVPSPYVSCSREYWATWGNMSDIFMVTSCPPGTDKNKFKKCEQPDNEDQDQATPVSVLSTSITYRNTFCAQCHNESNVRAWQYEVSCTANTEEMSTAKTRAELWRIVVRNPGCAFKALSPADIVPRQCFHEDVRGCRGNVSERILNLCTSFTRPITFMSSTSKPTRYKNVVCAACDGVVIKQRENCSGVKDPPHHEEGSVIPDPLSVLLNFNHHYEENTNSFGGNTREDTCWLTSVYEPFSMTCQSIRCSRRRIFMDGVCQDVFASGSPSGYSLDTILRSETSSEIQTSQLANQYLGQLKEYLQTFQPVLIRMVNVTKFQDTSSLALGTPHQLARVRAEVVTTSKKSRIDLEDSLLRFTTEDFPYHFRKEIVAMSSHPHLCLEERDLPSTYKYLSTEEKIIAPATVFPKCALCLTNISFEPIQMNCPFVEYANYLKENFTFNKLTGTLDFGEHSFLLAPHEFRSCGKVLRICTETIANVSNILFSNQAKTLNDNQDLVLSIVSLTCISFSLAGLLLTFLVYCFLSKLRTLPGKNSMALMFHLFCSHLLFLTTSNRTSNAVLCQVFGVLLHYFWMASFTWMLICAYHMYTVFTRIRAFIGSHDGDRKRLVVYSIFGSIVPVLVVASCIITHIVSSEGKQIGYGGSICFLNSSMSLGIFFVGPLALILLMNAAFFAKTILAIRSVPDMKEASNKSKKHHVIVYIKLSLLFGFTWIFGIFDTIITSTALEYVFIVLTGSQGLLIFVAYCLNGRIWKELKGALVGGEGSSIS